MYIYLFIIFLIILFNKKINTNKMNFFDVIILFFMITVCGLRKNVGTDYGLYKFYYGNLGKGSRFEIGFKNLMIFCNKIGCSYNVFIFIIAAITIILFYLLIKRYSKKPADSIFYFVTLGYYAFLFNIIRQMLAISISLFGIKYIKEKNFIKYLVVIVIASLFHLSALIMIPVYFLLKLPNNRKINIALIFICICAMFLYNDVYHFVIKNFTQYSAYSEVNAYTFTKPGLGTYIVGLVNFVLFIVMFINRKKIRELDDMYDEYFKLFSYSLIFTGFSFVNSIAVRAGYYLSIYMIFLLPYLGKILFKKENKKFEIIIVMFFIAYYVVHLVSFNKMIPYNSII